MGKHTPDRQQKLQSIIESLEGLGVPAWFSEKVFADGLPWFWRYASQAIASVPAIVGFAGISVLLAVQSRIAWANAEAQCMASDCIGYSVNPGLAGLIILLSGLLLALPCVRLAHYLAPSRLRTAVILLSVFEGPRNGGHKIGQTSPNASFSDINAALRRYDATRARWAAGWLAALLMGFALIPRDLQPTSLIYADRVDFRGFVKVGHTTLDWTDVTTVQLGCNQTDSGSSIIYEVENAAGDRIRLSGRYRYPEGRLAALEHVDAQVSAAGADFVRWSWLQRDPVHPECLQFWRGYFGEDFDRLAALLRLSDEELGRAFGVPR